GEYAKSQKNKNIVLSPMSIIMLLGIAADAVSGKTRDEITEIIGKEISWHGVGEAGADGSTIPVIMSGVVDSIIIRQGISYAKAGDQEIALTDILEIRNPGTGESGSEESGSEAEGGNEAGEQA
ncbi:MAG: hypothetical protein IKE34_04885, partial [Paenibacillus sp.]|nr:hypothetical protein [Paenibacillus sp.]